MQNKKKIIIIIWGILCILALTVGLLTFFKVSKINNYKNQLTLGDKYLQELNYENAEICYLEAISINATNVKPYIQLSNMYVAQGRYFEAEGILYQALEAIEEQQQPKIQQQLDIVLKYTELTEETIWEFVDSFSGWIFLQGEQIKQLTYTQKVEICIFISVSKRIAIQNNGYFISEAELSKLLYHYFDEELDLSKVEDTFVMTVQEGGISFIMGDPGITFLTELLSIQRTDSNHYSVTLRYYIDEGVQYDYSFVTLEFTRDLNKELWYYLSDIKIEYVFEGFEEQESMTNWTDREAVRQQIVDYYTALWQPDGTYASFEYDDSDYEQGYVYAIRYQMSEEAAERRIREGLMVAANTYVTTVWVNTSTGEVMDEHNTGSWYLN